MEGPVHTTAFTSHGRAEVVLGDNPLGMGVEQLNGLARSVLQRSWHPLAMVVPSGSEHLRLPESAQSAERDGVLAIDCLAQPEAAAYECRRPGYQILDREHSEITGLVGQCGSPRKTVAKCAEQVDADCTRLVDQL